MSTVGRILDFLDKVTDAAKEFAPIASDFGIPLVEKVAGIADSAVEIAQNILDRAEDAKVVLTSEDKADIEARIEALRAENNRLAEFIRNS